MSSRGENCDNLKGSSGEIGCFQTLWSTWKLWAHDVLGYVPEPTYYNQKYVISKVFEMWKQEGLSVREMLWRYNGTDGNGRCHSGVNKFGAKYDSCAYANAVLAKK